MWTFIVWRNFVKSFSERKRDASPAMRLGLSDHRWSVGEVLGERLFPERAGLPERWADYYWKRVPTRALPRLRGHTRRYAA
jgi:hypothetical protein